MSVSTVSKTIGARTETLAFNPDPDPHIVLIDKECCLRCETRPCVVACPVNLYNMIDGQMDFNCDGCIECGSCRIVCPHQEEAMTWRYPVGGHGVTFHWG